ncbi:RNA polymerase sigma factor [Phyllobacterium myrsinacearum]|uniref:RNA polymerase sigma-70 factor (ECF subfamily) n=1 Tax=Phyllobacterium myrsinacearum TaxID=28101 RepID=A0A839EPL7_9HYPH|nr:RNA polymerase sigma factor [Phyllobacterium myrsinacearum]MBA8878590.1 RNA polymerase sigma-70 factor (ECF subfamily) [Phyllobacterium myrsinacearum]
MVTRILDTSGLMDDTADVSTLVAQARAGDRTAFSVLVEQNYDFIHRIAWRWSGNRNDAEDIAQDVCIKLGSAIRQWRGQGALRTWLYQMTLNAARDHMRRYSREKRKAEAYHRELLNDVPVADGSDIDADVGALWAAVKTLPDKTADAVLLVYGEGLNHAHAAEVLDCAEATVSWHIHDAKKRLKRILRAPEGF